MPPSTLSPCGDILRLHRKPLYLCALFAKDAQAREALFTLFALEYELSTIPDKVSEPMVGLIRLQWWRDAIKSITEGKPAQGHPIALALGELHTRTPLPYEMFETLLNAHEAELEPLPFATPEALYAYITNKYGSLFMLGAMCLNGDPFSLKLSHAASAWGTIELLLSLPRARQRNYCFFPTSLLEETGIKPEEVYSESTPLHDVLIQPLLIHAKEQIAKMKEGTAPSDPQLRPLFLLSTLAESYLERIAQRGIPSLWQGKLLISPLMMQWVLMKQVMLKRV
ncbi:MAG: squalene/phytoene synthase [Rickettsiales bacterium]|jgi:phytoene synthase|nr:squalene/phytoene synthase [Rickettsiales bacterium]